MAKWRIYYRMDGDIVIDGPETEEEAREAFYDVSTQELAGNTYSCYPEIDDLHCEGD